MYHRNTAETTSLHPGTPQTTPLLLSVPQAARLLGIGTTLCWDMVHTGQLFSIRLGRRVLVPRVALEQLARVTDATNNEMA